VGLALMSISFIKDSPSLLISPNNFGWTPVRTFWDGYADGSSLI